MNKLVLDAARKVRRELNPKQIKKGRGRPRPRQQAKVRKLNQQRAHAEKLFRRRHALVRKRSKMSVRQTKRLNELTSVSPTLLTLRMFTDDVHELFSLRRRETKDGKIRRRMRRSAKYLNIPSLAKDSISLANPT